MTKPAKAKPGAEPEVLKIDMDWQEALKKSLQKKRPVEGWPDEQKKQKKANSK